MRRKQEVNVDNLVVFFTVMLAVVVAIALLHDKRGRHLHIFGLITPTYAHEHQPGESDEQARVIAFYQTWHRPKGDYSIVHRMPLCCYARGERQDCFPVLARRFDEKGHEELTPDVTGLPAAVQLEYGGKWYSNAYHVTEDEQPDPRESPDGRSHMCITGQSIVCYVRGSGQ